MCGRFSQCYTWSEIHAFLDVIGAPKNLQPRYNIAPTTTIDVVQLTEASREIVSMHWGLVPIWWKQPLKKVPATFNARAETVTEKPMFRTAFKKHRCLISTSGFHERTGGKGDKVPHLFTAGDGSPVLAFAGLWDHWTDPESGDDVLSATIIVSGASEWMTPFHDRMPVLLMPDDFDGWLSGELGPEVLKPAAESALRERVVSKRVNRTGHSDDDPTLFDAVKDKAA